jgi:hypothetical protein
MPREEPRSHSIVEPDYPWGSFLSEIDEKLTDPIQLQCLGGYYPILWNRPSNVRYRLHRRIELQNN